MALVGTEVKSLRDGQASMADAFATVDDGEIWLRNLHIPEYHHGSWTNHAPRRNRKLLLHRSEIDNLIGKIRDGNLTLVPLSLYFFDGKVKVELALARGKQAHDKRQDMARRDARPRGHSRAGPARQGHDLTGDRLRAAVGARLRRQRFRRRHRVATGGRAAGGAGVLPGRAWCCCAVLAFVVGGHISTPAIVWGGLCGDQPGVRRVVVLRRAGRGPDLGGVAADGDPGRRCPRRRRGGAGGAARCDRLRAASCWRWSPSCWSVARSTTTRTPTPHRFTTKVAWLTVGSGLAFGLNFVLIDQAPVDARLWPLVFARISASVLVLVIAAVTGNLAVPSGMPLRLALLAGGARHRGQRRDAVGAAGVAAVAGECADLAVPGGDGRCSRSWCCRERVTRWQAVGMVLALVSVAMIAAG